MAREPLRILLAVRERLVDGARAQFGDCLRIEAEAEAKIRSLDAARQRDRQTSGVWQDAYHFLEIAAMRGEAARAERQSAVAAWQAAVARSLQARDILTAARTAAETVEQLIDERAAAKRVEGSKREQHVLDDIARASHRQRGDV